jgi:CRP-like cAMP-binding protein
MNALVQLAKKTIVLERGEFLVTPGVVDTHLYYIESGSVRIFILDEEEQNIRFGYRDNLITALDSLLSGKPTQFYIQALKKTTVKVIAKSQVDMFFETEGRKTWNAALEDLILQQMEREVDLLTQSPRERYERVLKRSPRLFQEIPHKHIANYLRMTPETLSRLKKS